jgi:4-amino-4-deoxychorismate lyase
MCRFIETIQVNNKKLQRLAFHNFRFNETRKHFFNLPEINLADIIQIPDSVDNSIHRCRIVYSREIVNISFSPYTSKTINTLKIVEHNTIDYTYKYADRTIIDQLVAQRGDCDEILIVKNGLITDTSIANVVFTDGKIWDTPLSPLLNGTHRRRLLDEKRIEEKEIRIADINRYTHIRTINAMLDESLLIPVKNIIV